MNNKKRPLMASAAIMYAVTAIWALAMIPSLFVIHAQKTIHPAFTDHFTLSDIVYLLNEIFSAPGEYYAWLLSAVIPNLIASHTLAILISTLLFLPFTLWPFLSAERHRVMKRTLCLATMVFAITYTSLSIHLFLG